MQVELVHRPGNTAAKVSLGAGQGCTAEAGAMIAMSPNMSITTTTHTHTQSRGSFFKAAKRMAAGESFFLNHFVPEQGSGELWLGTGLAGDMLSLDLAGEGLIVQSGSFLAGESGIDIDLGWQGFKSLFSGEGMLWLHLRGPGKVVLSSFGAIYPIDIDGEYSVDSGHIVAFDQHLGFSISKAGKSWLQSFLGGEGLVCRFRGRGRVWCQSHKPASFGHLLGPKLKVRKVKVEK